MLKYVKTFVRNKLDLALINSNTLVTLFFSSNIHVRMNEKQEIKL